MADLGTVTLERLAADADADANADAGRTGLSDRGLLSVMTPWGRVLFEQYPVCHPW
jgi:hypothetical protein